MGREREGRGLTGVSVGALRDEALGRGGEEVELRWFKLRWRCQVFEGNGGLITRRAARGKGTTVERCGGCEGTGWGCWGRRWKEGAGCLKDEGSLSASGC